MKIPKYIRLLDVYFSAVCLSVTTVVTSVNVIWRYLIKSSIPWAQEVSTLAFTWCIMIGMSCAFKYKMHYGVDFLVVKLKGKAQLLVYILIYAVLAVGCAFLTYLSVIITREGSFKLTPYFQLPYSVKYVSAVIGFGLMTLYSFRFLYLALFRPDEFLFRVSQEGNGLGEVGELGPDSGKGRDKS